MAGGAPASPDGSGRSHVVVLASEPDLSRDVAGPLRRHGFAVHEAEGAEAALGLCRALRPAVAVLDRRAGDGLAAELRRDPELFGTAVLLAGPQPLCAEDLALGVLDHVGHPPRECEVVARVRSGVRLAELRHELERQSGQLEELAYTDDLTQLYNRRFLDGQLNALVASARRHGRVLAVVLIDIDRFKPLNDDHGHEVGDLVLREVSQRMLGRLREEDLLGRWGGEEFLALLPDTGLKGALHAAEDLRGSVAEGEMAARDRHLMVTVSAGVAEWVADETPRQLLRRADAALYAAKDAGRDRVCVAAPPRPA